MAMISGDKSSLNFELERFVLVSPLTQVRSSLYCSTVVLNNKETMAWVLDLQ